MFLMERCWAGVVNILGIIRRLFEIQYVYSPTLTVVHVYCPEDMRQLYSSIAGRQHMSVDGGMKIHGSTSH